MVVAAAVQSCVATRRRRCVICRSTASSCDARAAFAAVRTAPPSPSSLAITAAARRTQLPQPASPIITIIIIIVIVIGRDTGSHVTAVAAGSRPWSPERSVSYACLAEVCILPPPSRMFFSTVFVCLSVCLLAT